MKPIPEKTEEILFNRYFLQAFELGEITTYAPTTVAEAKLGYDSRFQGPSKFREIYLQFKAPTYRESRERFRIEVTPSQHQTLRRLYPQNTAYYVAHAFTSLKEWTDAQRRVKRAVDFLRDFVAIEIASLPDDVRFFEYHKPASHQHSPQIAYQRESDSPKQKPVHEVKGDGWLRGNQLVDLLKEDRCCGRLVRLISEDEEGLPSPRGYGGLVYTDARLHQSEREWRLSPRQLDTHFSGWTKDTLGIHMRKFKDLF